MSAAGSVLVCVCACVCLCVAAVTVAVAVATAVVVTVQEVVPALWPCTHIAAVGINCVRPPFVPQLLRAAHAKIQHLQQQQGTLGQAPAHDQGGAGLARHGPPLALVCYPNSGEGWDERRRAWVESAEAAQPQCFAEQARAWAASGGESLRVLGGCCRTTPAHIQHMCSVVRSGGGAMSRQRPS